MALLYKKRINCILLFLFFSTYLLAQEDFTPLEQCTYENEKFWIKILNLCPEGNITCDKVVYVGVNKNNGKYIVLNGKSIVGGKIKCNHRKIK